MGLDGAVFLTGFPGFIASRLLRGLACKGERVLLLVQPALIRQAQLEIGKIVQETKRAPGDFSILPGDITEPALGLSTADLEMVRSETSIVFHLAALYDLAVARELAMRINVEGTRHVNDLMQKLPKLRHYHYVSTCYVAGRRQGRILESELRHDSGFRNYYEETKYLAEIEVESLKARLPVTIYRPSVVCGDSKSGETPKFDGVYYLIRYLLSWPAVLTRFNIGNHEVSLNLVPVDFVVAAMLALAQDENVTGATLQLADPNPPTTHELFNSIAQCINGSGSTMTIPAAVVHHTLMLPGSPAVTGLPYAAVPYFFLKQTYDTTRASKLLAARGIFCPPFNSYVKTIVDYAAERFTCFTPQR